MRSSTWIERGPDGHPCYVKRKPALPSIRQTIAEAIHDIRQRNPFFNKDSPVSAPTSASQHAAPSSASQPATDAPKPETNQKQKSQLQPEMAQRSRPSVQPPHVHPPSLNQTVSQPQYYHFPGLSPFVQPFAGHGNNQATVQTPNSTAMMSAHLPHYAVPHPRMYPYVPVGIQAPATQPPTQQNNNVQPSGQSSFGQTGVTRFPTKPDDLRPKCNICGRFRSARYQWKHRVASGQLPSNICRRCRKEVTDSENESTDSYEKRSYRRQSRNRLRSRSRISRSRSKARSASKLGHRAVDFDYYADPQLSESSDSQVSQDTGSHHRRSRCRKGRSPDVEVIRYVDLPTRPRSRKRMTVYVEDYRSSQDVSDEDGTDVRYVRLPAGFVCRLHLAFVKAR